MEDSQRQRAAAAASVVAEDEKGKDLLLANHSTSYPTRQCHHHRLAVDAAVVAVEEEGTLLHLSAVPGLVGFLQLPSRSTNYLTRRHHQHVLLAEAADEAAAAELLLGRAGGSGLRPAHLTNCPNHRHHSLVVFVVVVATHYSGMYASVPAGAAVALCLLMGGRQP